MAENLDGIRSHLRELSESLNQVPSVPDQVHRVLRGLIFSGELKPGDCIIERKLARELGIGQPTAREALNALQAEGLVVRRRNAGCYVTSLSEVEFAQVFSLRIVLEGYAAQFLAENRDQWKPDDLLAALGAIKAKASARDVEGFYQSDMEFHRTIWHLTGNPFLEKMLMEITLPLFSFVMVKVVKDYSFDLESAASAHRDVAQAIISGDGEHAKVITTRILEDFRRMGLDLLARSK